MLSSLYIVYVILMIFNTPISECIQGWLDTQRFKFLRCNNNSDKMADEDHIELTESTPPIVQETDSEINHDLNSINHSKNEDEKHLINETHRKKHENDGEKYAIKQNSASLYGTSDDQAEFIEEALRKKKGKLICIISPSLRNMGIYLREIKSNYTALHLF